MAEMRDMQEFLQWLREAPGKLEKAIALAQLATVTNAEGIAKRNSTRQFIGRNGRRLSGTLLNSIYSTMERDGSQMVGVLGTRNIPYGAIHEFGSQGLPNGAIVPRKAKHLWIPQHRNLRQRMTPREFIQRLRMQPDAYFLNDKVAGQWMNPKAKKRRLTPLFFLVDRVEIPERPYLRPAMATAVEAFPGYLEQYMEREG